MRVFFVFNALIMDVNSLVENILITKMGVNNHNFVLGSDGK